MANPLLETAKNAVVEYVSFDGALTASLIDLRTAISSGNLAAAQKAQAEVDSYKSKTETAKSNAQAAIDTAFKEVPGANGLVFNAEMQANKDVFDRIVSVNNREFKIYNTNISEYTSLQTKLAELTSTQANANKKEEKKETLPEPTPPVIAENKASDDKTIKQSVGSASTGEEPFKFDIATGKGVPIAQAPIIAQPAVTTNNAGTNSSTSKRTKAWRPNPLSQYSSVTYKISLYAITPDAFNSFYQKGEWTTKDLELIVQSGGIGSSTDSKRNKWFEYDFGIDNLEIITLTNAKETATASNSVDFRFQIYEPYAMTFPSRLVNAEIELQRTATIKKNIKHQIEALNSPFLLVIRFYGYDVDGNIVTSSNNKINDFTKTDETAAFERAFPILITKFQFKLENKTTVYDIQAKTISEQVGYSSKRGIVQGVTSITADTVGSAIGGGSGTTKGLLDILNNQQEQLVAKKKQQLANVYKVLITDSVIEKSLIVEQDFYVKSRAPIQSVKNSKQSNVRTSNKAASVNKNSRVIEVRPGDPILTVIDQIISQSTFITESMSVKDIEEYETDLETGKTYTVRKPNAFGWYNVTPAVKIIGVDNKTNDYAYEITYIIQRYTVPYVRSLVTGTSTSYAGANKIYQYYYTGQNTEILNYEQQYNLLYFNTAALGSQAAIDDIVADGAPNSSFSAQFANPTGKLSGKMELQNNIKTFLYSPGDQLKAQLKILGDPDYIMPATAGSVDQAIKQNFSDSYTINPNTGQVFIEIGFNQVEDYGTMYNDDDPNRPYQEDGLMTPNNNITFWDYPTAIQQVTEGRMVYMITRVTSKFHRGLFTQDLKTILPNFPNPDATDVKKSKSKPTKNNDPRGGTTQSSVAVDSRGRRTAESDPKLNGGREEVPVAASVPVTTPAKVVSKDLPISAKQGAKDDAVPVKSEKTLPAPEGRQTNKEKILDGLKRLFR